MAQTKDQIGAVITAQIAANTDLVYTDPADNVVKSITNNTSRRALWKNWKDIFAACQAFLEQLTELYIGNIETIVSRSNAGNSPWLQDRMFKFQYDALVPQVLQLIDLIAQYPIVDASKRIITACSITSNISNRVSIKVAKNSPLEALTILEINAAQAYATEMFDEGIFYEVISLPSNKLYVAADIYYLGQYSAVISDNVIAAITAYLQQLSVTNFDGKLKMIDLEILIKSVSGVSDVVMKTVKGRADAVLFSAGVFLIQNGAVLIREYNPDAGYMIPENTSGQELGDSLNFIAV